MADGRAQSCRRSKNPKPKRPEIRPFESWEEVEAIAAELGPRFGPIAVFAGGTGLRPEEWVALERRDVDREARVVTVERVYSQGVLKPCGKSSRQRRRVPTVRREAFSETFGHLVDTGPEHGR